MPWIDAVDQFSSHPDPLQAPILHFTRMETMHTKNRQQEHITVVEHCFMLSHLLYHPNPLSHIYLRSALKKYYKAKYIVIAH